MHNVKTKMSSQSKVIICHNVKDFTHCQPQPVSVVCNCQMFKSVTLNHFATIDVICDVKNLRDIIH